MMNAKERNRRKSNKSCCNVKAYVAVVISFLVGFSVCAIFSAATQTTSLRDGNGDGGSILSFDIGGTTATPTALDHADGLHGEDHNAPITASTTTPTSTHDHADDSHGRERVAPLSLFRRPITEKFGTPSVQRPFIFFHIPKVRLLHRNEYNN